PGKGLHNVVFVATEHDSVYAFDADTLAPLWKRSLLYPALGTTPVSSADVGSDDIGPEIGITGTPVIDPTARTLYVVAQSKATNQFGTIFLQQLHALDLGTGAEKFGGPVNITATVPGTGDASVNGRLTFNPLRENQRGSLTLANGTVYVTFAGNALVLPYHGW